MNAVLQDLRYYFRQLFKTPGFTITAILSLTLGIGATTAVFSVIYAILMNPYPYAGSDRMVHMRLTDPAGNDHGFGLTGGQWQQIRKSPAVEDAFASDGWSLTVTGHDLPEDVNASYFTSNAFQYFGVPMALGRGLEPADAIDGQEPQPVVVLSYKFWQRHFGSDRGVIGRTLQLVRKPYFIVGVAPPRFTWDDADVYLPLKITQDPVRSYYVGMRIKPGVSRKAATDALKPLIDQFQKQSPTHFPKGQFKFRLLGLNDDFERRLGGTLSLLLAAVAFLLLIGCGNVSILQLARGAARQNEFSIRAAIGAARIRLIRQMLSEALLISVIGAGFGVLLAYQATKVITELLPKYSFPHEAAIQLNVPVLAFCVLLALVTGILSGLWPALQLSRPNLMHVIQSSTRRVTGGGYGRWMNKVLIGGQIALTLVMLAGAGAAMRGFLKLLHTPLGYEPRNVMSVGIPVHDGAYPKWESRAAYFELLRNKVAAVPGVRMAAISTNATPPSNGWNTGVEIVGRARIDGQKIRVNFVSPGYFPLLRIPLAQGRLWTETENHNAGRYVVINETMAKMYFPNGALGRSLVVPDIKGEPPFQLVPPATDTRLTIIGVIADKRNDGLRNRILPEIFVPYTLDLRMWTQILVRSDASPLRLLHAIGQTVNSVDADQQISGQIQDLEHWIQDQPEWAQEHLVAWLFGSFAVLALTLAAAGLYSVVSFSVAQRTNEFGIRMALGAQTRDVLRVVFASAAGSVGGGLFAGLILTLALNKVLARWAENSSRDAAVLLFAVGVLLVVAVAACTGPARRAAGVDPMKALRYE